MFHTVIILPTLFQENVLLPLKYDLNRKYIKCCITYFGAPRTMWNISDFYVNLKIYFCLITPNPYQYFPQ